MDDDGGVQWWQQQGNNNLRGKAMKVYQAINKVQAALAKTGISKSHKNAQQGYSFRGIDDVYQALSPLLAEHGLCILPRIISRECTERATNNGRPLFCVAVEAEFDLVCAEDSSTHTIRTFGEAMDSADKATNKAMSAAYKYAALQAFSIPAEGDNDADATTPEPAAAVISASQIANICALIDETGADTAAILKYAKVEKMEEIPLLAYPHIIQKLEAKRKEAA